MKNMNVSVKEYFVFARFKGYYCSADFSWWLLASAFDFTLYAVKSKRSPKTGDRFFWLAKLFQKFWRK